MRGLHPRKRRPLNPGAARDLHDMVGSILCIAHPCPVAARRNDFVMRMQVLARSDEISDGDGRTAAKIVRRAPGQPHHICLSLHPMSALACRLLVTDRYLSSNSRPAAVRKART